MEPARGSRPHSPGDDLEWIRGRASVAMGCGCTGDWEKRTAVPSPRLVTAAGRIESHGHNSGYRSSQPWKAGIGVFPRRSSGCVRRTVEAVRHPSDVQSKLCGFMRLNPGHATWGDEPVEDFAIPGSCTGIMHREQQASLPASAPCRSGKGRRCPPRAGPWRACQCQPLLRYSLKSRRVRGPTAS